MIDPKNLESWVPTKAAGREMLTPFNPAEWLTSAEAVAALLTDAEATADPTYIRPAKSRAGQGYTCRQHGHEDGLPPVEFEKRLSI